MERREGAFRLTPDLVIVTDTVSRDTGKFLAERLRPATGYKIKTTSRKKPDQKLPGSVIILTTENASTINLGAEGCDLSVTPDGVTISAPTQAGLFYGAQMLLQLLPPEIFSSKVAKDFYWEIPCVKIADAPHFPWRGMLLDVSRHFFTKQEVKKTLDTMALYKLNTLHWHLVDDHGWRIEIKKYPKLTSVGAWRPGVGFGFPTNSTTAYRKDGPYGGYYTQKDIREVVAYARKLHITVVPEIEMPGHSLASQALMKREGLKTQNELQSWFTRRMEKFINAHGKTLMGWSEIRQGGLAPNTVLMDWIGGGHDVVMASTKYCYFNEYQSRDKKSEPLPSGAFVPLRKAYEFEPVPASLAPEFQRHILGAQGNLWTEFIPNQKIAEYMAFPRQLALAEVVWSPKESRDNEGFLRRLKINECRLDQLGVNYRSSALGDGTESQSQTK